MKPAISIQRITKEYTRAVFPAYLSLREMLSGSIQNLLGPAAIKKETFKALDNISIEVAPGERLGIIGRNGAGKSTLLKIISRITPPTKGKIILQGRVGSLLEVGTGFHPELSGRENIFLNGSILGLTKAEIKKQLDAIIEFSGVEKFIETPLKHYSSGMQTRLAFAVASHLHAEILLIDEVLAVGDLDFQSKCIGKMEEVSREEGRTILFISHNMDSIRKFCHKAILLDEGKMVAAGSTENIISEYISKHVGTRDIIAWETGLRSGDESLELHKVWLHDRSNSTKSRFDTTQEIGISAEYTVLQESTRFTHGLNVYNQEQVNVFNSHDTQTIQNDLQPGCGQYTATVWIPGHLLPEGKFSIDFALFLPNPLDVKIHAKDLLCFEIFTDFNKPSARGEYVDDFPGIVRPWLNWSRVKN